MPDLKLNNYHIECLEFKADGLSLLCELVQKKKSFFVYVAGPYSSDPNRGTQNAIDVARDLVAMKHVPFIPHLCHLWDFYRPEDYSYWIDYCIKWIERCDLLVRLPGDSKGADLEVERASELNKPIIHLVEG